jgi:hypothetical protein
VSESLTDFATRVGRYHKVPTAVVSSTEQTQCIHSAVRTYSTRNPRLRSVELTPNSASEWNLSTEISGWADGFAITEVLYEYGTGNILPIDTNEWHIVLRGSTWYLRVPCLPSSADGIWVYYASPHTVGATSGDTTLPAQDLDAVAKLAASECCALAAVSASDEKSSTISADSVDFGSIPISWRNREEELRNKYHSHMNARYPQPSVFAEWDTISGGGRRSMFHNGRAH